MLLEFLAHAAALDFFWILFWPLRNPLMTFMIFAVIFIFVEGQKILYNSLVIFIALFAFLDLEKIIGIPIFVGSFLLIYYISKFAVLSLAENNKILKKYLFVINELHFFVAFILTILFIV